MHTRSYLRQHDVRPRKGLGQHFLTNKEVLVDMARAARLAPDSVVVEVGPGAGALTEVLAGQAGGVLAIELDAGLIERLQQALAAFRNVRLVHADILEVDLAQELAALPGGVGFGRPYKVVANLPYYITTPILRYFFQQERRPDLIVVTVQEEVARRMMATPPRMNFLAVLMQTFGRPEIVRRVPAGAFYPPPKVDSAVVRVTVHPSPLLSDEETPRFLRLVSAGFGQPRKQVHNPLGQFMALPRTETIAILEQSGIEPTRRAETLSLAEWLALYQTVSGLAAAGPESLA